MATLCKLYRDSPQLIPPNTWTLVTFERAVRNDRHMQRDYRLIVPPFGGDFIWSRNLRWAAIAVPDGDSRPRQFMSRFIRDPHGARDDTGAADHPATPGRSWETTTWQFAGQANQPVGVEHAQFVAATWDY